MTVKPVYCYPHPMLRKVSLAWEFERFAAHHAKLFELERDLVETMLARDGAGISAIQIGIPVRAFALDGDGKGSPVCIVNPSVTPKGSQSWVNEGCLSFPDQFVSVRRYSHADVTGWLANGKPYAIECKGLMAQAAQHEMEHLDGKLLWDHASSLQKKLIDNRMQRKARLAEKGRRDDSGGDAA